MNNINGNPDTSDKYPPNSFLNKISTMFTRIGAERSEVQEPDREEAVLTSFRTFADSHDPNSAGILGAEGLSGVTTTYHNGNESASVIEENRDSHQIRRGSTDTDLVQVTMVETYSDTETEEEESEESDLCFRSHVLSKEPHDVEQFDGRIPIFRLHSAQETPITDINLAANQQVSMASFPSTLQKADKVDATLHGVSSSFHSLGRNSLSDTPMPLFKVSLDSSEGLYSVDSPPSMQQDDYPEPGPPSPAETADIGDLPEQPGHFPIGVVAPVSPNTMRQPDVDPGENPLVTDSVEAPEQEDTPSESQASTIPSLLRSQSGVFDSKRKPEVSPHESLSGGMQLPSSTPGEKPFQLPALFSGLRVLKKGAVGEERETVAEIRQRDTDLALLQLKKPVNKGRFFAEPLPSKKPRPVLELKSNFLEQLTQRLTPNSGKTEGKEPATEPLADQVPHLREEGTEGNLHPTTSVEDADKVLETPFDAFKAFFTQKQPKKDSGEAVDLEAVKRKIKNEKEVLKAIFERSLSKPDNKDLTDGKVCHCKQLIVIFSA